MTDPNMATLTASLERSLRNFSLNHSPAVDAAAASSSGLSRSDSSSHAPDSDRHSRLGHRFQPCLDLSSNSSSSSPSSTSEATTTLVELNSHISLPYHWEQCLDLQTGEIYYKNWRNGMKAKEDPRLIATTGCSDAGAELYYTEDDNDEEEEEDEDEDEDEDESYDSEGSSTTDQYSSPLCSSYRKSNRAEDVLVVAGCKRCLMYYMVPKHVLDCPKCAGELLHFERSENSASH